MAMSCIPNGGAGSRTVVVKLLVNYGPIYGSFMFLKLQFCSRLYWLEKYGLEYGDFMVCQCWTWTNMPNRVYCSGSEHEDPVLCVVA